MRKTQIIHIRVCNETKRKLIAISKKRKIKISQLIRSLIKKEDNMAAKKGSCGGTPRVGKKGDSKGRGLGVGRRRAK